MVNDEVYYNMDNGGKTFKIEIKKEKLLASIYDLDKTNNKEDDDELTFNSVPVLQFIYSRMIIGNSTDTYMSRFSGGENTKNCAYLFELENNVYIFVIDCIIAFVPHGKIIKFIAVMGNSSVVYPYMIDDKGNYYIYTYYGIKCINISNKDFSKWMEDKLNHPYTWLDEINAVNVKDTKHIEDIHDMVFIELIPRP